MRLQCRFRALRALPAIILLLRLGVGFVTASPGLAATPPVSVRVGDHPGFGRVVFVFPQPTSFHIVRDGDRIAISFDAALRIPSSGRRPRHVLSISGGDSRAEIAVSAGARIRSSATGKLVVLDVLGPEPLTSGLKPLARVLPTAAAPPRRPADRREPEDAATAASPAAQPVPEQSPPREPPSAPVSGPAAPSSPPARPPAPASPTMLQAAGPASPSHAALLIRGGPALGAAAFRRGDWAFVVLDERHPIDLSAYRDHPVFGSGSVHLFPAATLVRFRLRPGSALAMTKVSDGWTIEPVEALPELRPISPALLDDRLNLPAQATGQAVSIADPDSGELLAVGTLRAAGPALPSARQAPGFLLLPTWLGIAVEPLDERLALRIVPGGFVLDGGEAGLGLARTEGREAAFAHAAGLTRLYNFPTGSTEALRRRLQSEIDAAAAAPPLARGRLHRQAAETMIALGLGAEAQSLLQLATTEDGREAARPETMGLAAVAALLAGRAAEADAILHPKLDGTDEVTLWRAVRVALRHDASREAASGFAATAPLIMTYPEAISERLLPMAAETMALGGLPAAARSLAERHPGNATLALARAIAAEAEGDAEPALAAYDALARSSDRLLRARAGLRGVQLRLALGRMDAAQAATALEALLLAWRGDGHELALRLRLAELHQQGKAWRQALSLLRDTEAAFPDDRPVVHARLKDCFAAMLRNDAGSGAIPPLAFIALVDANADMLPDGPDAEPAAAKLADRLLALDLPKRAEPVLRNLSRSALAGPARASLGARLAALRLQEGDASGALEALSASAAEDLPATLVERRTLLRARAIADQGDVQAAARLLTQLGTPAADEARAEMMEAAKDWPAAAAALTDYITRTVPREGKLDDGQRRLMLRLATSTAQAADLAALSALRRREEVRMGDGPLGDLFRLLTAGPVQDVADLPRGKRELALARSLGHDLKTIDNAIRPP